MTMKRIENVTVAEANCIVNQYPLTDLEQAQEFVRVKLAFMSKNSLTELMGDILVSKIRYESILNDSVLPSGDPLPESARDIMEEALKGSSKLLTKLETCVRLGAV